MLLLRWLARPTMHAKGRSKIHNNKIQLFIAHRSMMLEKKISTKKKSEKGVKASIFIL